MANILNQLFINTKKQNTSRQQIFDLFVRPLLMYLYKDEKEENFDILLEQFFCTDTRKVSFAYAKVRFKIPGLYCTNPNNPIPGYGNRDVAAKEPLILRADVVTNRYDLQRANSKDDHFFRLTRAEMEAIMEKVNIVE
jgi:hypothetical protein